MAILTRLNLVAVVLALFATQSNAASKWSITGPSLDTSDCQWYLSWTGPSDKEKNLVKYLGSGTASVAVFDENETKGNQSLSTTAFSHSALLVAYGIGDKANEDVDDYAVRTTPLTLDVIEKQEKGCN
ncbi:hypothetical protein T439DRAFT_350335 [Meredithblackwellia eburnea MCA 4105]